MVESNSGRPIAQHNILRTVPGPSKLDNVTKTWWWNTEVQEAVIEKREKKRERDLNKCEETIRNYKQANKKAVAKAKCKANDDLYTSLEGKDGQLKAMRIAKQKNRESQDVPSKTDEK